MNQYVFEEERPVVDTKCGKIRGIAYGGVNIFMGIDYAKAKRFQMPVEIEPWEGIKNAYQHGPISKQVLKLKPFYTYRPLLHTPAYPCSQDNCCTHQQEIPGPYSL